MLVLTRKVGEVIAVGDNIVVTVAGISGAQVRIGIEAPRNVEVIRPDRGWSRVALPNVNSLEFEFEPD